LLFQNNSSIFVTNFLYYLTILIMIEKKEGFKGERMLALPPSLLEEYAKDAFIGRLYLRKAGFFPMVKYHYIKKEEGTDYHMLIYCTHGKGWYDIGGKHHDIHENQYILLPAGVPYSFGADNNNPWTIYWVHYEGTDADFFHPKSQGPIDIEPSDTSRIQHRLDLFEELFSAATLAYQPQYMAYASICLQMFLASFTLLEQYRHFSKAPHREDSLAMKVIYYMQENIQQSLSLQQLASHFNYSSSQFSMLFKQETGSSPIEHFIRLKIQRACQYIELTDLKFNEIALRLGFDDPAYFSRIFNKVMGISPSVYREKET
jgi:AraC-like DNA-binding protein